MRPFVIVGVVGGGFVALIATLTSYTEFNLSPVHVALHPTEVACDRDATQTATLQALDAAGLYPTDMSGCDWLKSCTADDIARARRRAEDIRKFANTLPASCAKNEYLQWAWWVDYETSKGEEEMRTHETKNLYGEVGRNQKASEDRARDIFSNIPKPGRHP